MTENLYDNYITDLNKCKCTCRKLYAVPNWKMLLRHITTNVI